VSVAIGLERCLLADGFDVEIVHDGAVGLERVRRDHFGLIVLDILLPSVNGYRVCQSIRSEDDWTPIVLS
jgi:DNA-binding response OmpR family regulator